MPYKDLEKRKQYHADYNKKWSAINKDKLREKTRLWMQKWRDDNPELAADKMREWRKNNGSKSLAHTNSYKRKNTLKAVAHRIVFDAKRNGELKQSPCQVCGNVKSQAHHEDYSRPLDVIWLCQKHHSELHKKYKNTG